MQPPVVLALTLVLLGGCLVPHPERAEALTCDPLPVRRTEDAPPQPLPDDALIPRFHTTKFIVPQPGAIIVSLRPCEAERYTLEVRSEEGFRTPDRFAFVHFYETRTADGLEFSSWESTGPVRKTMRLNENPWTLVVATSVRDMEIRLRPEERPGQAADETYVLAPRFDNLTVRPLPPFPGSAHGGAPETIRAALDGTGLALVRFRLALASPDTALPDVQSVSVQLATRDAANTEIRSRHVVLAGNGHIQATEVLREDAHPKDRWDVHAQVHLNQTNPLAPPPRADGQLVAYPLREPNS